MLEHVDNLVDEKLSLLGIETRLSDHERGLMVNLKQIEKDGDGGYRAIYEHESQKKQVLVGLAMYKGAENVEDFEQDKGGGITPEHNGARNSTFLSIDDDHIHRAIFTVKTVEVRDIDPTNPRQHI